MTTSTIVTISATLCLAILPSMASSGSAAEKPCVDDLYRGFDSRLAVAVAAKLPPDSGSAVGFEIVRGRPVVAYPHRVIAVDGTRLVGQPSIDLIAGIAVDKAGGVWLQSGSAVRKFGESELLEKGTISAGTRIHNSGAGAFLLTGVDATESRFALRAADGTAAPAFRLEGTLRVASLNRYGMAAIVGDALVMWPTGGHGMSYVARDAGLKAARDVCLVGPNRLVVALSNALVMISDKGRLILGAVSGRVRYDEGTLYVLDERTGLIWTLNGLDAVGIPEKDAAHAANLLRIGGDASQRRAAFEEAVRIMGCKAATGRRQSGWK